jgi:PAS domain S-box-containing protein
MARVEIDPRAFAAALSETTQALVCVLDREGRILSFNAACERITGIPANEAVGRDARELVIPPEEVQAFTEVLAGVWETARPSPQVGHWMTRDGQRRLIAWSNKPVLGSDGSPAYLVTSGLDITERERTAAELDSLESDLEARLGEVGRLAQEQTSLRRVATLVAAEAEPERVFEAVSEQCARVLGTGTAAVLRFGEDGAEVVGRFDREGLGAFPVGTKLPLEGDSAIATVYRTGGPARIDDYSGMSGEVAEVMRQTGALFTIAAPILVAGRIWGAVVVTSRSLGGTPEEGETRLRDFAELVSLAVAGAEARRELRASRSRLVQAADYERRRLEQNLHGGAQQRLVSMRLALRLAREKLESDPALSAELLESARGELDSALSELRELAQGLHPGILSEGGLGAALAALAERAPLPVLVAGTPAEPLPEPLEIAAYYVVAEALANAVKHAGATSVTVSVSRDEDDVVVTVRDDGSGGADPAGGVGIVGLRDRAEALGGTLEVESPPGGGTVVRAVLPLER